MQLGRGEPSWAQSPPQDQTCCSVPPLMGRRNGMTRQGLDGSCSQMRFLKQKRHAWVTFSPVLSWKNPARASPLTPSYSKSHANQNLLYYCQLMAIKPAPLKQHYLMNFLINIFFPLVNLGVIQYFCATHSGKYSHSSILLNMAFK